MASRRPFAFFDLGETIIDLKDTIRVLSDLLRNRYRELGSTADEIARTWFVELAHAVPRDDSKPFRTQYEVGAGLLHGLMRARAVEIDEESAGAILRRAWAEWQSQAKLCEGVTKEWLQEVRGLTAGVGAVTDGDEADVHRLLEKTGLLPYFDSVTTSEAVRAYKPSSRVYRAALDSLHASPEQSVFVSDSVLDLVGAAAIGLAVIWLRRHSSLGSAPPPPGTLILRQPIEVVRVLSEFQRTQRFEVP